MRHGRGFRRRGQGMGRMRSGAGMSRRSQTHSIVAACVSMLPAPWNDFMSRYERSSLNERQRFFPDRGPAFNALTSELEEPVHGNDNKYERFKRIGAETLKAQVDKSLCSGCGACQAECPAGAIRVSDVAEVDANLCSGCAACVEVCPLEALSMK